MSQNTPTPEARIAEIEGEPTIDTVFARKLGAFLRAMLNTSNEEGSANNSFAEFAQMKEQVEINRRNIDYWSAKVRIFSAEEWERIKTLQSQDIQALKTHRRELDDHRRELDEHRRELDDLKQKAPASGGASSGTSIEGIDPNEFRQMKVFLQRFVEMMQGLNGLDPQSFIEKFCYNLQEAKSYSHSEANGGLMLLQ